VEATIPLLAQACSVVLPTRSGGAAGSTPSTRTDAGSVAGSGVDGTPTAGDISDPGDELATVGGELVSTGDSGDMGPSRGNSFTVRGGGARVPTVELLEVDSFVNGGGGGGGTKH
jgi:hypothetical protein